MKKNSKAGILIGSLAVIFSLSSCTVEYRERHPRPKRVIVVGQATQPEQFRMDDNTVAATPVNRASDGVAQ